MNDRSDRSIQVENNTPGEKCPVILTHTALCQMGILINNRNE